MVVVGNVVFVVVGYRCVVIIVCCVLFVDRCWCSLFCCCLLRSRDMFFVVLCVMFSCGWIVVVCCLLSWFLCGLLCVFVVRGCLLNGIVCCWLLVC